MFTKLFRLAQGWRIGLYRSFGGDISTPAARWRARVHSHWVDHAWIRKLASNTYPLGAHAWRSSQPDSARFDRLAGMGVRSVINLRGSSHIGTSSYLFEKEACARNGMRMYDMPLLARRLASREAYLELLDLFASAEKPLLIHCKSGADRSGLAAAFYLIDREGVPAKEAKKQLALKYAHFRWTRAGILDHLLEAYEAADSANPIALREWLTTRYDPAELTSSFTRSRWWWRA